MTEAPDIPHIANPVTEAEQAVLAACLWSRVARDEARNHITGADFLSPHHETIWDAMARLDRHKMAVDPAIIHSALGTNTATRLLPDLTTNPAVPGNIATYAAAVRSAAVLRRLESEARRTIQLTQTPGVNAQGLSATVATRFAELRDAGITEDAQSITLGELLADPDDEPDWLIPGLLERRDRLMLTGEEGLGKSYLLRQIAIMAAAGLDPFDPGKHIPPVSVTIVDCENSKRQIRRKARRMVDFALRYGEGHPDRVNLLPSSRIDIVRDRDLARLHHELDATQPDLVIIGPLYRLVPRALQTDDEAAPLLAALDTIRDRFGAALLIEAHAGHALGKGGVRDLRPRGSSALLGWPEFGYGMRTVASGYADLVPWRGDRDERKWPGRVRHDNHGIRWIPTDSGPVPGEEW